MSGYGYHWTPCRGSGGGKSLLVLVLVLLAIGSGAAKAATSAISTVLVITLITVAVLAVAAIVAAVFLLARRIRVAESPAFAIRAAEPREAVTVTSQPQVTATPLPAITPPQVVNFNFYGADERAAAIIRQALPGAVIEGEDPS